MEHQAEHSVGFPPFKQIDTFASQIFWLAVTFAILYFVLSTFLLPKIRKTLAVRDATIRNNLTAAAAASEKADAAVQKLEAQMAAARASARDTASRAKAEADAASAQESAKAEAEVERRLASAEQRIAEVRAAAMANVVGIAEGAAQEIAQKLTGVTISADAVQRAVAAAAAARTAAGA